MSTNLQNKCYEMLNTITKWKSIFAGWQLGSRPLGDPECDAVRDHREISILQRLEVNALTQILYANKIFTQEDFEQIRAKWNEGITAESDQEAAVQDHRGVTISLRVEISAISQLLCEKGIMTPGDFQFALIQECKLLEADYERRFPGMKATSIGMHFYDVQQAAETMKKWKP